MAPHTVEQWATYRRWNHAVADVVYTSEAAGSPVYLDLEEPLLAEIADRAGFPGTAGRLGLIAAVRDTLGPLSAQDLFRPHLGQLRAWRASSGEPPPVIALLAVFCLAAEDMRVGGGLASHNYYSRLLPLLGFEERDKPRVAGAYRGACSRLWETLNDWLEDLQGERGLPTAYAFSHEYVGLPISQALVRGVDRDKLSEYFGELSLPPRTRMSPPDMSAILDRWMARTPSPASNAMRNEWRDRSSRERIVEIACQLLASRESAEATLTSTSVSEPGSRTRPAHLQLSARLGTFPEPRLELGLLGSGPTPSVDLVLSGQGVEGDVAVGTHTVPGGRWAVAEPDRFDPGSLLSEQLTLESHDGAHFVREPRGLIPFVLDDLLQVFVETERLGMGVDGLVLCREGLADVVERALTNIARPGFDRWTEAPDGTPETWVLFSDVQVITTLPECDPETRGAWPPDVNLLLPLGISQVVLEGGLQLPGHVRRWSALAVPELRITTPDAERIDVTIEQTREFGVPFKQVPQPLPGPSFSASLAALGLPDGDYEVLVKTGAGRGSPSTLDAVHLRLRSADTPNPTASVVGQTSALAPVPWPHTTSSSSERALPELSDNTPTWWGRRSRRPAPEADWQRASIVLPATRTAPCVETGAHHLELPLVDATTRGRFINGTCSHCGLVKRQLARYQKPRELSATRRTSSGVAEGPRFDAGMFPKVEPRRITPDMVLDALSYEVHGSPSSLRRLALQVDASSLSVDRLSRALEVLGHIDLRDGAETGVAGWCIRSAALVQTSDSAFVLTGHRSRGLLAALRGAVGDDLGTVEQELAPTRLLARIDRVTADRLADTLIRESGVHVEVIEHASERLAGAVTPLSQIVARLRRRAMPGFRACERWDPEHAHWEPVTDASTPGTYRLAAGWAVYCIRDESDVDDGMMRAADSRTVKHAAALAAGEPLSGYDSRTSTLYVPLGADLPVSFARAAVTCSGLVPEEDVEQRVTRYRDVPPAVAATIVDRLGR